MKRPWYINLFCIIGWMWLFILFPSIFSPETKKVHLLLPTIYGLITAFLFIALVGVWHLKKWGLELFFISLFIKNYLDNIISMKKNTTTNAFHLNVSFGFIFFLLFGILITILYYKKMSKEL